MPTMNRPRDHAGRAGAPRPRGPVTGPMQRMIDAAATAPAVEPVTPEQAAALAEPIVAVNPHLRRAAVRCRFCQSRIVLAMMDGGRRVPIDLAPDPAGTIAVRVDHTFTVRARYLNRDRPVVEGTEKLHVVHFATCGPRVVEDDRPEPAYRTRARHRQTEDDEEQWT